MFFLDIFLSLKIIKMLYHKNQQSCIQFLYSYFYFLPLKIKFFNFQNLITVSLKYIPLDHFKRKVKWDISYIFSRFYFLG